MFNVIIQFRVRFQPIKTFVTQDAILLCYSCHKFQRIYFIYNTNFDPIIIASQLLYQGYKILHLVHWFI